MVKHISSKDIENLIKDIEIMSQQKLNATHIIELKWILFCFEEFTNNILEKEKEKLSNKNKYTFIDIKIIFEKNKLKHYFWQKYLIHSEIQELYKNIKFSYIWISDGDIIIRDMNWKCFWFYVDSIYQPAIFQPSIIYKDNYYPSEPKKHYQTTLYPLMCNKRMFWKTMNNFDQLFGIETQFVEIQTPVFNINAWYIFIKQFNEKFIDYIEDPSDWGSDWIWCNMINDKFLFQSKKSIYDQQKMNHWQSVKQSCYVHFNESQTNTNIPCMIIHATPVKHLNTRTHPVHNIDSHVKMAGTNQLIEIEKLFPNYFKNKAIDQGYWRVFKKDSNLIECDSCKEWNCDK